MYNYLQLTLNMFHHCKASDGVLARTDMEALNYRHEDIGCVAVTWSLDLIPECHNCRYFQDLKHCIAIKPK